MNQYSLATPQRGILYRFAGLTRWPRWPMAASGCPADPSIRWKTGTLYQDCEDTKPDTHHSLQFHLKAYIRQGDVQRSFCMKTSTALDSQKIKWPSGKYCIYHWGRSCPLGMAIGRIQWDDENVQIGPNKNYNRGTLPSGTYNSNTWVPMTNTAFKKELITRVVSQSIRPSLGGGEGKGAVFFHSFFLASLPPPPVPWEA